MNKNKKTKNKKINEAISNMKNSMSFQALNDVNTKGKDKKNNPEDLS